MTHIPLSSLLVTILLLASQTFAAAPSLPPSVSVAVSNNTAFACDLYAQLKGQEGNLFFSSYSVSTALAMTYAGARGETATQMAKALRFTLPPADLHPAFAALSAQMTAVQQAGQVQLSIANSLWPHKSYPFLEDYLALVKKNYGTTITPVDFAKEEPKARAQINQWVEEKTQKKITNVIGAPLDQLTRLVLVNAVYFKGKWESQFKKHATQNEPFYRISGGPVQAPLMKQTRKYKYFCKFLELQLLELPYVGNELSMLVILPSKSSSLMVLEKNLSAASLQHWRGQMYMREIELYLPTFKITWGISSLVKPLTALGMRTPFTDTADFGGMDGHKDLFISDILHKAFVDVTEEGTEAAAATAALMRAKSADAPQPPPPELFRADRPFLFLIQENRTGSILFLGRVTDPTAP